LLPLLEPERNSFSLFRDIFKLSFSPRFGSSGGVHLRTLVPIPIGLNAERQESMCISGPREMRVRPHSFQIIPSELRLHKRFFPPSPQWIDVGGMSVKPPLCINAGPGLTLGGVWGILGAEEGLCPGPHPSVLRTPSSSFLCSVLIVRGPISLFTPPL